MPDFRAGVMHERPLLFLRLFSRDRSRRERSSSWSAAIAFFADVAAARPAHGSGCTAVDVHHVGSRTGAANAVGGAGRQGRDET